MDPKQFVDSDAPDTLFGTPYVINPKMKNHPIRFGNLDRYRTYRLVAREPNPEVNDGKTPKHD